jgi:hypothetical protein
VKVKIETERKGKEFQLKLDQRDSRRRKSFSSEIFTILQNQSILVNSLLLHSELTVLPSDNILNEFFDARRQRLQVFLFLCMIIGSNRRRYAQ